MSFIPRWHPLLTNAYIRLCFGADLIIFKEQFNEVAFTFNGTIAYISHQVPNCTQSDITTQRRSWEFWDAVLKKPKTLLLGQRSEWYKLLKFTLLRWLHVISSIHVYLFLEVEIMSNIAVKLPQGKLIVIGLMFMTKYSCCYNSLKLFCLYTRNKMAKHIFLF